jgi:hypothetical protein
VQPLPVRGTGPPHRPLAGHRWRVESGEWKVSPFERRDHRMQVPLTRDPPRGNVWGGERQRTDCIWTEEHARIFATFSATAHPDRAGVARRRRRWAGGPAGIGDGRRRPCEDIRVEEGRVLTSSGLGGNHRREIIGAAGSARGTTNQRLTRHRRDDCRMVKAIRHFASWPIIPLLSLRVLIIKWLLPNQGRKMARATR